MSARPDEGSPLLLAMAPEEPNKPKDGVSLLLGVRTECADERFGVTGAINGPSPALAESLPLEKFGFRYSGSCSRPDEDARGVAGWWCITGAGDVAKNIKRSAPSSSVFTPALSSRPDWVGVSKMLELISAFVKTGVLCSTRQARLKLCISAISNEGFKAWDTVGARATDSNTM